jgi:hypothetical protein
VSANSPRSLATPLSPIHAGQLTGGAALQHATSVIAIIM